MDIEIMDTLLNFGFAAIMSFYLVTKTTTALNNLTVSIQNQTNILIFIASKIKTPNADKNTRAGGGLSLKG